jgi:hypothetical protein
MDHVRQETCGRDCGGTCVVCCCFVCKVCGLLEGALTTECLVFSRSSMQTRFTTEKKTS